LILSAVHDGQPQQQPAGCLMEHGSSHHTWPCRGPHHPSCSRLLARLPHHQQAGCWVLAGSPTETFTRQVDERFVLQQNIFCLIPHSSLSRNARGGEGGRKWDFRWDVRENNPTRGPRSHTKHETNPGITPQRGFVRPHFRVGSRW
jgi:hypothetical protein